ncbi:MAG: hypothetical protein IPL23_22990 [Saprospiraceae bacterium]|nr:hypothetical protein [Saprospiraceae bacterium]
MSEFYKKIKNHPSLNQNSDAPTNAWDKFKQYREKQSGNRKGVGMLPWILGAIAGILFCTNFIVLNKLYKTNEFLAETTHDTVYIVEYRDRAIVPQEAAVTPSTSANEAFYKTEMQTAQAQIKALTREINSLKKETKSQELFEQMDLAQLPHSINLNAADDSPIYATKSIQSTTDQKTDVSTNAESEINPASSELRSPLEIDFLPSIDGPLSVKSDQVFPPKSYALQLWQVSPDKPSILEFLKPKAWSAGLAAGYYLPSTARFEHTGGFLLDLLLKAKLSNRFSANLDITGISLYEQHEGYDAQGYIPIITGPPTYQLEEVQINQKMIQSAIGLTANLRKNGRLMPYLGAAFGVGGRTQPLFKYKFESTAGELYINNEAHQITSWFTYQKIHAGLSYGISNRIDLGLDAGYQFHQTDDLNGLYFKTRMLWNF